MIAAIGSVAERFNAPVLKTDEGLYPSVSSNLTASAKYLKGNQIHSLIPFSFGTILALFEILAISSLFLSELIHFA